MRSRARRLFLDTAPLRRDRDYRGLWSGDTEAAAVATLVGPQAAVESGGILCLLGIVVVARLFPELVDHTIRRAPPVPVPMEASLDSKA